MPVVNCVAYRDGRKVADIPVEDIDQALAQPGTFVWVALKDPDEAELAQMQSEFGLHELAVEDARRVGHQRPKVEEYGDTVFAVLQVVQRRGEALAAGEVCVFAGPNYVLSVRRGFEPGFAPVRSRVERESELLRQGSGFVLYALMDDVVDRYFPLVDELEERLEAIESRIFRSEAPRRSAEELYALKHELMTMRHAVDPLLEAVHRLYGGRVPAICTGTQEYFRDVKDHLVHLSQALDGLREMVLTAIQVNLAFISLQYSEITKRLAAYAALVAVPTLIAGIYGMNFERMPELKWAFGYPTAVGAMVVADLLLLRRFRRIGWL